MAISRKIQAKPLLPKPKPDTVLRAGITANLKFTRGKQLVEHSPFNLIPDPNNPRPGEQIDEKWLKDNLLLGTDNSLCTVRNSVFNIPEFDSLNANGDPQLCESYDFLKSLAYSIREEGLIEPVEIFLADKNNDPEYFDNIDKEYGYVVLEGHQRRLAAMMAEVPTITCIEITDEAFLAKLKVKHRKLRRQLSENNLRKNLTVSQNYLILKELLLASGSDNISVKELASIVGLNDTIIGVLKRIILNSNSYPKIFIKKIENNELTFKAIRVLSTKSYNDIETILSQGTKSISKEILKLSGSKVRRQEKFRNYANLKVSNKHEAVIFYNFLVKKFPEFTPASDSELIFKNLEELLLKIKGLALGMH